MISEVTPANTPRMQRCEEGSGGRFQHSLALLCNFHTHSATADAACARTKARKHVLHELTTARRRRSSCRISQLTLTREPAAPSVQVTKDCTSGEKREEAK